MLRTYLQDLVRAVPEFQAGASARTREMYEGLAMPPTSLGKLESLGATIAGVTGRVPPPIARRPVLIVAAGDHGIAASGVTWALPGSTSKVVRNIAMGRSACNAIARTVGATVIALDVGIALQMDRFPLLETRKVAHGTDNFLNGHAMSQPGAMQAISAGYETCESVISRGADVIAVGEVGTGNTTSSVAIICALLGITPTCGADTGYGFVDGATRMRLKAIEVGLAYHAREGRDLSDPVEALLALGGLETAANIGVALCALANRLPVVLDGLNTLPSALIICCLRPDLKKYFIGGTNSPEHAAQVALEYLALDPLVDLGLRLGEGTGALLAIPLLQACARLLTEVATLEESELP